MIFIILNTCKFQKELALKDWITIICWTIIIITKYSFLLKIEKMLAGAGDVCAHATIYFAAAVAVNKESKSLK
jgi:hypothetical protein